MASTTLQKGVLHLNGLMASTTCVHCHAASEWPHGRDHTAKRRKTESWPRPRCNKITMLCEKPENRRGRARGGGENRVSTSFNEFQRVSTEFQRSFNALKLEGLVEERIQKTEFQRVSTSFNGQSFNEFQRPEIPEISSGRHQICQKIETQIQHELCHIDASCIC